MYFTDKGDATRVISALQTCPRQPFLLSRVGKSRSWVCGWYGAKCQYQWSSCHKSYRCWCGDSPVPAQARRMFCLVPPLAVWCTALYVSSIPRVAACWPIDCMAKSVDCQSSTFAIEGPRKTHKQEYGHSTPRPKRGEPLHWPLVYSREFPRFSIARESITLLRITQNVFCGLMSDGCKNNK